MNDAPIPHHMTLPPPPPERSVWRQVQNEWQGIIKRVSLNKPVALQVNALTQKLNIVAIKFKEGKLDPNHNWETDIDEANFLHNQNLKWMELVGEEYKLSIEYWKDLTSRQFQISHDMMLAGVNFILIANGGVALGCLSALTSEKVDKYKGVFKWGMFGSFVALVVISLAIALAAEWMADLANKKANKLVKNPAHTMLRAFGKHAVRHHGPRAKILTYLIYGSALWTLVYLFAGYIAVLNVD